MKRIPSLDGLRALSILLVLNGHLAFSAGFRSWYTDIYAHAGVLIFFVISGYLITTLMLSERQSTGELDVTSFYVRRMFRLLPVAFAYLIVVTLSLAVSAAQPGSPFPWISTFLSWGYLASYAAYFGQVPWNLSHLWSLSVEEQFYVVWPLIMAFWPGKSKALAWAAVLMAPIVRYELRRRGLDALAQSSFPAVIDSLATGCLLALYAKRITLNHWSGLAWPLALFLPALLKIGSDTRWLWPLPQFIGHSVWSLFNIFVAIGTLWAVKTKPRILNHSLPIWIGTLSYSLYLWQMPIMNPELQLLPITRIFLAFGCAMGSYYLIEKPVLARSRSMNREATHRQLPIAS